MSLIVCLLFLGSISWTVRGDGFQKCFDSDSISCLQIQAYRMARNVLEKQSIPLFGGLSLNDKYDRKGRTDVNQDFEAQFTNASVSGRQFLVEDYLQNQFTGLWSNRTIYWNAAKTARSLSKFISSSMKQNSEAISDEGRGKKKQMKMMLPLLMAIKMKVLGFLAVSSLAVSAIAKKALVTSVMALLISSYLGFKTFFSKNKNIMNHYGIDYGHEAIMLPSGQQSYSFAHNQPEFNFDGNHISRQTANLRDQVSLS